MTSKHTLADTIVQDSLEAVTMYNSFCPSHALSVYGGTAVQLHTFGHYPGLARPTHDVDLDIVPKLTADAFRKDVGEPLAGFLLPYAPQVHVLNKVYEVGLRDPDNVPFFVHSYKWTQGGWERQGRSVERRARNATTLAIPTTDAQVKVCRLEDLLATKHARLQIIAMAHHEIPESLHNLYKKFITRDWGALGEHDLQGWLPEVMAKKETASVMFDRGGDEARAAKHDYVSAKDLFDVCLIAKVVREGKASFDEQYYDRILTGKE